MAQELTIEVYNNIASGAPPIQVIETEISSSSIFVQPLEDVAPINVRVYESTTSGTFPIQVIESEFTGVPIFVEVQEDYAPVQSVNGKIGWVVIDKNDVGLSNVENISITGVSGYLQNQINNISGGGSVTGDYYPNSNPSGFITGVNLSYYITTGQTGAFYPRSNPSGFITGVDLSELYPRSNPSGFITGVNLSAYVTTGQTGDFYPRSNPSGFITGVDLSLYATISNLAATGSTLSTNLASTGSTLTTQINSLSGVSVLTYGNQTIDGIKTFRNSVYIHDLYVTGTEFIANVQNNFIESPYILLNLTGGAVDGGIFFVTGTGLTGVNDYGPILGFDHTSKFKFGIARRSDDLSTLNDIAAVQDITNYSGFVNSNFYGINNPNGYITGIENIVYITGDQLVSGLKTFSDNINTNQIKGITGQFIGNSLSLIGGDGTSFGGPVIIRGGTGVNAGGNIQLNSNVSANRGTNKSLGIQAFRSGQVGEASIDIDDTIFNVKNGLTFQISGETVDPLNYYTKDNPSGFITGIDTSNFYTNNNPSGFITNANVVYATGNQTIGGLKTFSSGIIITGGAINLVGKDVVGITDAFGESVIIRGGSGVGDGSAFSFANGGNITLIGGTALSGGFPPVTPGNVTIIGGSGGNLPTFAPLPETIGSINLYGGARTLDNRGGPIIAHGNIYINPDPIKSREFIIYKSGIGALGAADNLVVRQNSINVNNLLTVSGNPVLTGVNLSNYATTGQLSQASGNLQNQIDILSVNSIAYAIALG